MLFTVNNACYYYVLATCYCSIIDLFIWLTYRGVFPVGITLIDATGNSDIVAANAIGNYSFVYAKTGTHNKKSY